MLTISQAEEQAARLVAAACQAGADAADVVFVQGQSQDISVRLGQLEDVGRSEGAEIGLRLFIGHRSASVSSSDFSKEALDALVERAVAMAREAPEDRWAGLAPKELLMQGTAPEIESDDGKEIAPAVLRELALKAEDAARSVDGITNSEGASASAGRTIFALATSEGFTRGSSSSSYGCSACVIAGQGVNMQRDYDFHATRYFEDLDAAELIGTRAAERTIARLNPTRIDSGQMPIIFDPRVGSGFLSYLIQGISGGAITRKTSFLLDSLGKPVFNEGITIKEDPWRKRGIASRAFDGEGLPTKPNNIIEKGRLNGWLLDSAAARQLGMTPTGHARRGVGGPPSTGTANLYLEAGKVTPEELMSDIKLGIYVTEMIGSGVNMITGDYSRGASGFIIRDGQLAEPVAEITVAGNLKDIFMQMVPANDLRFRRGTEVPTLRVDGLMVAGQ
ncbi:peptidase U62 modulator of DNA gyrase [Zymomonas mobilis subsp. mobilis ZM4 = ATCC 31821]|uniref:Peptidase U62 modulator of DNA gyrase n=1 Tax=Zymomonas mobilis subsp. mobilis (strain ATCC 31821 / ZM4 / CP4) TaxID=264203 RepID=Q5NNF1_ZYMMO|nr:TldD/PmbA family protein [Zymomonas mobilis]AAV89759.1 peptidase U62 modulator of DNA gyrase [Zymomonas mobilis subsp. mobilis ZM4 = ATCC 31821]AVZ26022.1 peptidase U62 modulator of DNA gyrase [Zymomonas mobilis subsp. mobilis]AVZ27913.1 peptidase U62 modulator of DNA gyrase [Zymomonas mobilis subsp. mobilis]AVZ42360.1 peptidase U62 modulator of DNA gyrase [Zymomonas mobilis subsp. mobilis ZM4 = ATCC 31821]UBQ07131.1 TldD/PmbA family protein [Zymomonas mobilis]